FSFSCALLLVLAGVKKREYSIYIYIALVLCKAKTGLVGGFLYFFRHFLFRFIKIFFLVFIGGVLFTSFYFDGFELLLVPGDSPYKSLSNHFVGLVSGLDSGFKHLFTGNGLGTSGFLVYLSVEDSLYLTSPFHPLSPMLNGNESTFGVIAFQLGAGVLLLHVFVFFKYLSDFVDYKAVGSASLVLFIMVFQVSSESSLTVFVSLVTAISLAWLRKFYEEKSMEGK
ncbi:MAG: hypothetical protein RPR97_17340, partial [Colwellia sp.]